MISKSEALDVLKRCCYVDNSYLRLFESILSHIGYTVITLINLIILDKELTELDFSDITKLEFCVSSNTAYDSYKVSESRITCFKKDDYILIEQNCNIDCPMECVHDYPFFGEANISVNDISLDKRYATPISSDTYNIFNVTLIDGIEVLMDLCRSIDSVYANDVKIKNKCR